MKDKMKNTDQFPEKIEVLQKDAADKFMPPMSKSRIMKNLLVVCTGFLFLFCAYQGLANLQSTLNLQDDLGVVSQSIIYAALIASSLLLPKVIIQKFGCKWTLVFSILTYAPYIAANFYPHMGTFAPTAVLVGIGAAPLWSAKCTYINEISVLYASQTSETTNVVTSKFFGIFFMIFQNTQIWGNLASFYILKPPVKNESLDVISQIFNNNTFEVGMLTLDYSKRRFYPNGVDTDSIGILDSKRPLEENVGLKSHGKTSAANNTSVVYNDVSIGEISYSDFDNRTVACGIDFCSGINENLKAPPLQKRYMLTGVYLCSILLASAVVAAFLDPLARKQKTDEKILSRTVATMKHLKKLDQLLLVPLTVFSGIEQAFILSDYTKAYVACAWGLHRVGLVFICFGVVNAAMSFIVGHLVKYVSRLILMLTGAIGNLAVCIALFLWEPRAEEFILFFVIVGVWGLSDAIWQTQINALYGILFRSEEEAAFANYRLWESMGFFLAFGYSSSLCVAAKIYILLTLLAIGIAGYVTVEVRSFLRNRCYDVTSPAQ